MLGKVLISGAAVVDCAGFLCLIACPDLRSTDPPFFEKFTLDLLNGALVVVVVASDELNLRLVKPNGRGCETAEIVDLPADAVDVFVVDEAVVAGSVVNKISVTESSTSFVGSVIELVLSTLGLTLDGFSDGSTLIIVTTSVEVDVLVVDVVDAKVVVLSVVLDGTSEYSSSFVGKVVVVSNEDTLDKFSEFFEAIPLNLCTLVYLELIVDKASFFSVDRPTSTDSPSFFEFLKPGP